LPSTILQVHREFAPRGLSVLAINIREARGTVERWVRKNGIQFPVLLDSDGTVTRAYSVSGTPTVFLVGRTGQLVGKAVGPRGWMSEAGRKLLEALLDQPAG
jgi:peroxiredoxin